MKNRFIFLGLSLVILSVACEKPPIILTPTAGEEFSGGRATVFDTSPNAFGFQAADFAGDDELLFFVGNSFFNQNWVSAPASTTARDGLGPFFNARSCAACHFKDGRGQPPTIEGRTGEGLLLRLSIPGLQANGSPTPEPHYGTQLQDQAVLGVMAEGKFKILYTELEGAYDDGSLYYLRQPLYQFVDLAYGNMDPSVEVSPRVAPQMIGLGLLEAITEADLLSHADVNDQNVDGISGKPNYVWDPVVQDYRLGRFGWKANEPDLLTQSAAAFHGDIGIKTYLFPEENCNSVINCDSLPDGGEVEIDEDDLGKVVLYVSSLAVPARREHDDPDVLMGKQLFTQIGCASCHTPSYETGQHPKFDALSNQKIWPYTDLLLHDMGAGLADHRPEFDATGTEWRTPPLWGIGLFNVVSGHTFYLHDGRARNLEEAILWHGGEAQNSQNAFKGLSVLERDQIILFLQSL
ncbi:MAG: di-heme oxidoredictase family protein [Bacteroidota bacterium]